MKIHNHAQSHSQTLAEKQEQQLSALTDIHNSTTTHNKELLEKHEQQFETMQAKVQEACGQLSGIMSCANDELEKQSRLMTDQNARQDSQNNDSGAQRQRIIQQQLASVKLMKKQVESAEALYQQSQQLPAAFATAASNRLKETEQALVEQIHAGQDELGKTIEKAQSVHRDLLLRLFKALHRLYRICLPGNR